MSARASGLNTSFAPLGALLLAWLALTGFVISRDPFLGLGVGIAPILMFLLLRYSAVRVLAVSAGGMIVLGSSSDLGPNKIVYAAVVILCAVIAAYRMAVNPPRYIWAFRSLIWWGIALVAVFGISYLASPAGSDFGTFGRQSIFYLLIVLGPIIGLDSGRDLLPAAVYGLIGIIGVIAAAGFAADWLNRRGVTALPFGRFVLSSLVLPALAFGLAIVMVIHARRIISRVIWVIPVIAIPIAMLVTGTRTNLILFIAVVAVVGAKSNARIPVVRLLLLVAAAGAIGLALFPIVASFAVADPAFITQRIQAAISAVSGSGDQSLAFRQAQAITASTMIADSPFLGYGLGFAIPFTVDSPLLTVLRLGWVGSGLVVCFIGALSLAFWRGSRAYAPNPATTAWWAFLLVCLANIVFGTPLEDRGFGFAILLACMAVASSFQHFHSNRDIVVEPSTDGLLARRGAVHTDGTTRRRRPAAGHPRRTT